MNQCKECGSYAINVGKGGRDESDSDLCDVCYWRKRWIERGVEIERLRADLDALKETLAGVKSMHADALEELYELRSRMGR